MKAFFNKFYCCLIFIVLFLTIVMVTVKYKMYTLKTEIRGLEREIYNLSCKRDILIVELNYLSSPERLMDIYLVLLEKKMISEQFILLPSNIKDAKTLTKYYAKKFREAKK